MDLGEKQITTPAVSISDANLLSSDSSSRRKQFKGVVIQQNGHWGAQIYSNHRRIWLGTFKTQVEAARAYDSAAIRVRKSDSHRNFPWTDPTLAEEEPKFQNKFDTATLLNMIKDGSYSDKFSDYLRKLTGKCTNLEKYMDTTTFADCGGSRDFFCKKLFHKFLTPSDVSKLNRLVIPKKFAVLHFPSIPENGKGDGDISDKEMTVYDKSMRKWTFRYCYWKSSQSYVFTSGWNKFVMAKDLKAKDRVIFSLCKCRSNRCCPDRHEIPPRYMIHVVRHHCNLNAEVVAAPPPEKSSSAPPPKKSSSSSAPASSTDLLKRNSKSKEFVIKLFGVPISL